MKLCKTEIKQRKRRTQKHRRQKCNEGIQQHKEKKNKQRRQKQLNKSRMKTKGRQKTSLTINKIILKSKEKAGKKERNKKKLLIPQSIQNHSHRKTTRTIRPKARIGNQMN